MLPRLTSGQPGLMAFGQRGARRLYLAYVGAGGAGRVAVAASSDGKQFRTTAGPTGLTGVFGVQLAQSIACGSLLLASAGMRLDNPLELSLSTDGSRWLAPVVTGSGLESTPAVIGAIAANAKGWSTAYLADRPEILDQPLVASRTFNCDLSAASKEEYCFFSGGTCETFPAVGTPAWAILGGDYVQAVAEGGGGQILQSDPHASAVPQGHASDTGVSAAIDPKTGRGYLAWEESSGNHISLFDNTSGAIRTCNEYTFSPPAITFFKGLLWIAWRGGPDNRINVASLKPF
ncbi:MAG: hypothetical protein ACRD11_14445 [Terriglobia bacterium]